MGASQNRPALRIVQRHQQRRHRQLDGLAQSYLIGQHQSRTAQSMAFQRQAGEILLVRPQALLTPVDGRFHGGCGCGQRRVGNGRQLGGFDHLAFELALNILNDEGTAGQVDGTRIVPKRVEFLLHPGDRVRVVVFPQQLVIQAPGGGTFVDAAKEGAGRAILTADDAGLAMDQPEGQVRQHSNLHAPLGQGIVEGTIAW